MYSTLEDILKRLKEYGVKRYGPIESNLSPLVNWLDDEAFKRGDSPLSIKNDHSNLYKALVIYV